MYIEPGEISGRTREEGADDTKGESVPSLK